MIKKKTSVNAISIPILIGWKLNKWSLVVGISPVLAHSTTSTATSYIYGKNTTQSSGLNNPLWDNLWQINVDWNLSFYYDVHTTIYDFQVYSSLKSDWQLWRFATSAGVRVPLKK